MSLWLREEHRIVLGHDQVTLAATRREFTRRGVKRQVLAERVFPGNAAAGEMPWDGALKALEVALPALAHRAHVTVIVSNHFMHYALIPWSEALNNDQEEMAFARHSFRELYGSDADAWELRINQSKAGMAQLACAVDTRLLDGLRGLFKRTGISLHSIQPHLMDAYNCCSATLCRKSAWLVIAERGNLCLALLQDGHWSWVRSIRAGADWRKELPLLLEREELLANTDAAINEVFLWAPHHPDDVLPADSRWKFRNLQPPYLPVPVPEQGKQSTTSLNEGRR